MNNKYIKYVRFDLVILFFNETHCKRHRKINNLANESLKLKKKGEQELNTKKVLESN
jgi:hypothetical protein